MNDTPNLLYQEIRFPIGSSEQIDRFVECSMTASRYLVRTSVYWRYPSPKCVTEIALPVVGTMHGVMFDIVSANVYPVFS